MVGAGRVDRGVDDGAGARGVDDERLVASGARRGPCRAARARGRPAARRRAARRRRGRSTRSGWSTGGRRSATSRLPSRRRSTCAGVSISPRRSSSHAWQPGAQRLREVGQQRVGRRAGEADRQPAELAGGGGPGVLLRRARRRARMERARSSRTSPAGSSSTRRVVRRSSVTPTSASRRRMICESGDCAMCSRAAARPKCSSSPTATNACSWRISMATKIMQFRALN